MKTESGITGQVPEEIRILTFRIADVCFGMDMDQIAGMRSLDQINPREYRVCRFEEKFPFRRQEIRTHSGNSPMILILNDEEKLSGLCVDRPENINISVSIDSIRPMPALIEACNSASPIWGVALREGQMILLADFYKLMARQG
ncbi:MAG: chemotaxis protein CheW [Desulfobacterales bacterium]